MGNYSERVPSSDMGQVRGEVAERNPIDRVVEAGVRNEGPRMIAGSEILPLAIVAGITAYSGVRAAFDLKKKQYALAALFVPIGMLAVLSGLYAFGIIALQTVIFVAPACLALLFILGAVVRSKAKGG